MIFNSENLVVNIFWRIKVIVRDRLRESERERGERKRWEIENVENMFVSLLIYICRY